MTWFHNGGINGSDTFVSMVVLVAMTVVLKARRAWLVGFILVPTMSGLFLVEYFYPNLVSGYDDLQQRYFDVYITFLVSTIVIFIIIDFILKSYKNEKKNLDKTKRLVEEKMELLNQNNIALKEALANVQTLSGLLPICAHCKKIRDDKGYWNQIEAHIQKYTYAKFSHGICPGCSDKLYGNEGWYLKMKKKKEQKE